MSTPLNLKSHTNNFSARDLAFLLIGLFPYVAFFILYQDGFFETFGNPKPIYITIPAPSSVAPAPSPSNGFGLKDLFYNSTTGEVNYGVVFALTAGILICVSPLYFEGAFEQVVNNQIAAVADIKQHVAINSDYVVRSNQAGISALADLSAALATNPSLSAEVLANASRNMDWLT